MNRREFNAIAGAQVLAPLVARAQSPEKTMPVIGILTPGPPPPNWSADPTIRVDETIARGLRENGFVAGRNVAIEYRWADGHYDRLPDMAAELVRRNVDVIVTNSTPGALAAKGATSTIPVVFSSVGDPIGSGLVTSLARPSGNLTGFSNFNTALAPKVLELLCDLVPRAQTIALLVNPKNPYSNRVISGVREAAKEKRLALEVQEARNEEEIATAFSSLVGEKADALIVEGDPFFSSRRGRIVDLASRLSIPTIYLHLIYAEVGGLIVYGVDEIDSFRQAIDYAGRILKGAHPSDLPVQQPTIFRLIVNLRTAAALGLFVPQTIIARADEVIE